MTVREPEYSTADVDWLIASRRFEREPRNPYGVPLSEATAESANPASWHRTHIYEPKARRDYVVDAVDRERDAYAKRYPHSNPHSLIWHVDKVEV